MRLEISFDSIGTPSVMPSRNISGFTFSPPKIRIKSSSSDRKNRDEPGSPWRPARPRNWLSMRRASCRSVPGMCKLPKRDHFVVLRFALFRALVVHGLPRFMGHLEDFASCWNSTMGSAG